jgi:hypothetical protein
MRGRPKFSGSEVVLRPIEDGLKELSSGKNVSWNWFQPPRSSKSSLG